MTRLLIAFALTATALSGCTMAPNYKRPDMPNENAWPQGEAYQAAPAAAASHSAALVNWQSFFQTPPLTSLIGTALFNNRDLRIASLNIEAARAAYRVQRADLLPTVNAVGSATRQGVPENASPTGSSTTGSQYAANVAVTAFELDVFGRIRSLNQAALQQYLATEEARNAVQVSLVAEVANAYLTYLADRKLLEITRETLASQQEAYDVIKKSFDLGVGTQLDVSQAATTVETARGNLALYTRAVAQDKNALVLLLGAPIDDATLDQGSLDTVKVMEALPVGLPSDVLLNRPDIRQAEHQLQAANANIGAARAAFFPTISLTAALGVASGDLSKLFNADSRTAWNFAPQVTMPIFEGGRNIANLEGATANEKIAVAAYEQAIQIAFREVADELAARGTYTQQLQAQQALVTATSKSYQVADARYKQGIDNHLVVLDAQRSLYAAQQNEVLVAQQRLTNLVNLYKVLGGGQMAAQ